MPIIESSWETLKADIASAPSEVYVFFTGSKDKNGQSWCHPCRVVQPDIEKAFGGNEHHLLRVSFAREDFRRTPWPKQAWAVPGVPWLQRLSNGELNGTFLRSDSGPYGEKLDAYLAGPEAYEAYEEKVKGEEYVPPEKRWEWAHEDWKQNQEIIDSRRVVDERRTAWKKQYAEERRKEREVNGEGKAKGEETVEEGVHGAETQKEEKTDNGKEACTDAECAAPAPAAATPASSTAPAPTPVPAKVSA